jgi:pimeloyl-[acyl-carrier protein] methyl ester esterase
MSFYSYSLGEGPELVLLHGWGMNGDAWENILPRLSKHYRTTVVDLPGHGRSVDSPPDYTLSTLTAMLAETLPAEAMLVGWSLGGMLATQFALDFPQRVQKLALVASAPQFVRDDSWPDGTDSEVLGHFADGLKKHYQLTIKRFIALQAMGSEHAQEQQRNLRDAVFRHGNPQPAALEGGLEILRQVNLRPRLAEISCPSLLISGKNDALFRPAAAHKTQALFNDAQLSLIDGAGHAPFLSHPELFFNTLHRFLSAT